MKRLSEYVGYVAAMVMLCGWLVTILWYGKKINSMEIELNNVHKTLELNTENVIKLGTIIEYQTGLDIIQ